MPLRPAPFPTPNPLLLSVVSNPCRCISFFLFRSIFSSFCCFFSFFNTSFIFFLLRSCCWYFSHNLSSRSFSILEARSCGASERCCGESEGLDGVECNGRKGGNTTGAGAGLRGINTHLVDSSPCSFWWIIGWCSFLSFFSSHSSLSSSSAGLSTSSASFSLVCS